MRCYNIDRPSSPDMDVLRLNLQPLIDEKVFNMCRSTINLISTTEPIVSLGEASADIQNALTVTCDSRQFVFPFHRAIPIR